MFTRQRIQKLSERLQEKRRFIQVLAGPRQVGKTTLVHQALAELNLPYHYVSADGVDLQNRAWIVQQWDLARLKTKNASTRTQEALLVLDEVQKIPGWSEEVKRLWDEDTRQQVPLKILILGSAPLLMDHGLGESLAGRFEKINLTHWSYSEMCQAFGFNLEQFLYFGAYPGAAPFIQDEVRWKSYILDSLVETTLARDILLLQRIEKPALLRQLFALACDYSGQILSYQKMLGQLQEAKSTVILSHYLSLLAAAGMVTGLQKYSAKKHQVRASSPKLQVLNTALMSAIGHKSFAQAQQDRDYWGRLSESAIGAYLVNQSIEECFDVFYWREGSQEVDFVLRKGEAVVAIEVKTSRKKISLSGMQAFAKKFSPQRCLIIGEQGMSFEEFLQMPIAQLF